MLQLWQYYMCKELPKAIKEVANINCFKMEDRQVFRKKYYGGRNAKSM